MIQSKYIRRYVTMFCHRRDIYAVQKKVGSYFLVREPITVRLLHRHLAGELTCGWYGLNHDNTTGWVVLDADQDDGLMTLQHVWQKLDQLNIVAYLENSRRGGHLWVFTEPIRAFVLRTLMRQVLKRLNVNDLEIYPRQDELALDGVGSLVRGPLGIHRLTGKRYAFLGPLDLKPVGRSMKDQLDYLLTFRVNTIHQIAAALANLITEPEQVPKRSGEPHRLMKPSSRDDQIEELKAAIGDLYQFVSQYVKLDAKGRGSCPFHPPDRHPSFAVNRKEGYWVCFHEINPATGRYLGGDAIEFYRRLKGLSFKQAVSELAEQYGITDLSY